MVIYPTTLELWKTVIPGRDYIKIINSGDFNRANLFRGIGIDSSPLLSSFGITDRQEILDRQSILGYLLDNPMIAAWLNEEDIPYDLPQDEAHYLKYFDPKKKSTDYWAKIKKLIEMLDSSSGPMPAQLRVLLDALRSTLVLEEDEKVMSKFITERLTQIAVIEGLMDFKVNGCGDIMIEPPESESEDADPRYVYAPRDLKLVEGPHVHGHRIYSFAISTAVHHTVPDWTKGGLMKKFGVEKVFSRRAQKKNNHEKALALRGMVINEPSEGLVNDVKNGLLKLLRFDWRGLNEDVILRVYFSYSGKGLMVNIYSIDPDRTRIEDMEKEFDFGGYGGYQKNEIVRIQESLKHYKEIAVLYRKTLVTAKGMLRFEERLPNIFGDNHQIDSPSTDSEHRWFALENLYSDPIVRDIYRECIRNRGFIRKHISMLKHIAWLSVNIQLTATKHGVTISFPKIVDDCDQVVSFNAVYPVHLFPQIGDKKPIPIKDMAPVNGQIIGFTGHHGGGKTVAALGVIDNLFLAQSGLPVFGDNFQFNLKSIIGMVFIERGEGSTCEMLVEKIKNILEGIRDTDSGKIVLILDELGSATQENSGYELGRDLLLKLSRQKVSVLFSTQILSLAEYAKSELGAICYKFTPDHEMALGVADGGMNDLRVRYGINELLEA